MSTQVAPNFFAIIPATVRYCKDLEPSAKLLYGEITALCSQQGFCWASDSYFSDLYDVDERTVKRWILSLKEGGFISIEHERGQGFIKQRKIWISPEIKKFYTKDKNVPRARDKNVPYINTTINTEEKDKKKKAPLAPAITLNEKTQEFEGIRDEDLKNWQEAYPAVNVRKELLAARIWALSSPRKNYRKSLDTWMRHVNQSHTTPLKTQNNGILDVPEGDAKANQALAERWEKEYRGKGGIHYDVQVGSEKVHFIMPNNDSYSVSYDMSTREFLKLCQKAIKRMNLSITQ